MKWVTFVLGILLCLAPFVFGFSGTPLALWTSLICGVVILITGLTESYKAAAIAGLVVFLAPWVLGYSKIPGALWSCLLLGGAVAISTGYMGFFTKTTLIKS